MKHSEFRLRQPRRHRACGRVDPLNEGANALLIGCHRELGKRVAAIRQTNAYNPRMAHPLRIGIIGTGSMGRTHAECWRQTPATLAGFVSRAGASALAEEFGAPPFARLEDMLPHVEVVDICSPTHLHFEQTRVAAAAGKHVVCEKPLARSVADAEAMRDVCASAGVQLLVAHVLRYFPDYSYAHDRVARGEIGALREINTMRAGYLPSKANDNWFVNATISGGPMLDLMIHDFDFAQWVGGAVEQVSAKASGAIDDHAFVTLTHVNGAVSHIEGGWHLPPGQFRTRLEVLGSAGAIRADNEQRASGNDLAADVPRVSAAGANPYLLQAQEFYAALTGGPAPRVSAQDAIDALRIALAAIESAHTGKPVLL